MLIIGLKVITMEECSVCLELDTNKNERNVPANQINSSTSNNKLSNPWPKPGKLYFLKSIRNQNLQFEHILCRPKKVSISTSHSNLRKHVKVSVSCILFIIRKCTLFYVQPILYLCNVHFSGLLNP